MRWVGDCGDNQDVRVRIRVVREDGDEDARVFVGGDPGVVAGDGDGLEGLRPTDAGEPEHERVRRAERRAVGGARLAERVGLGPDRLERGEGIVLGAGGAVVGVERGRTGRERVEPEVEQRAVVGRTAVDRLAGEQDRARPGERVGGREAVVAREQDAGGRAGSIVTNSEKAVGSTSQSMTRR